MAGIGVTRVTDCPVCLGTFKDPRVLPCGHTFCLSCITEHGRSKGSDPDCPNCRTKFQIPSSGFEGLPKNYCLNPVLDESTSVVDISKAKVVNRLCKKHNGEELVLYCVQCSWAICLDCMEDHRKHDCCRISIFAKEARTQLEGYVNSIKPILSQVKTRKSEVEEESEKFRNLLDKSEFAINEECDNIIRLVNNRRRLLLEELSNEKQRVTKVLKMKTDEIETEQMRLASFNTRIEEMLQGADEATTFDIVCQYKDFKETFNTLKETQPQDMGQVSVTEIEFIPGDFKEFISGRENMIGRLQMESDSKPKVERNEVLRRDLTPSSKEAPASFKVKIGRPLQKGEYRIKVHQLLINDPEPIKFLTEVVISKGMTVLQAKMSILKELKLKQIMDVPPVDRCRLRRKCSKNPGNIYSDGQAFDGQDICLVTNMDLLLEVLAAPDQLRVKREEQLSIYVRRWSPSKNELGGIAEIIVDEDSSNDLIKKISAVSGLKEESVQFCKISGVVIPYDMSAFEIHTGLSWVPRDNSHSTLKTLSVYSDGAVFFYRDKTERLKVLSSVK